MEASMESHSIIGGGGVRIHLAETGNPRGRPILFIHGFSQCCLAWRRQMSSDLTRDYRLVAMDLRGHGRSDKPRDGYTDSRLWADDVNAVLTALHLAQELRELRRSSEQNEVIIRKKSDEWTHVLEQLLSR